MELSTGEAAAFFRDGLVPYVGRLPLGWRMPTMVIGRNILNDPAGAASSCPVFELHAQPG